MISKNHNVYNYSATKMYGVTNNNVMRNPQYLRTPRRDPRRE